MTVQKDGEAAVEYSCKKFAAQFAKTQSLPPQSWSDDVLLLWQVADYFSEESYGPAPQAVIPFVPTNFGRAQDDTAQIGSGSLGVFSGQLLSETYKKTKVSTCGRAGRGEGLTKKQRGTEQLRCKLGGLDPDLVDDLTALGPFPCSLEFRTPCNNDQAFMMDNVQP